MKQEDQKDRISRITAPESPIVNAWCRCGKSRKPKKVTNGANHDVICDVCKKHVLV